MNFIRTNVGPNKKTLIVTIINTFESDRIFMFDNYSTLYFQGHCSKKFDHGFEKSYL